jgi:hypothetical protein
LLFALALLPQGHRRGDVKVCGVHSTCGVVSTPTMVNSASARPTASIAIGPID